MRVSKSSLRNWRTLVFGSAFLAVAICAATEYWGILKLDQVAAAFRHGDTALALATEDMRDEVLQLRRFEKDVLLNVGSPELVQSYQAKWEDAFSHLRYDLTRARRSAAGEADSRLQEVVDSIAVYRTAFLEVCDQIHSGVLATPQQANAEANRFREAARNAELALNGISESAFGRTQTVDPALFAQRCSLAISLALFIALVGLYVGANPHPDSSIDEH
jgi:methyl-accepting chemotaxis protein